MTENYDFIVVGGGIAGASTAANLSRSGRVCLVEMEDHAGYHSTGRSAALFSAAYGNDAIRKLTRASRDTFFNPSDSFRGAALVKPRGVMVLAHEGQDDAFQGFFEATASVEAVERLTPSQTAGICPIVRPELVIHAAIAHGAADIEVHELHQGYLRNLKQSQGVVRTGARVTGLAYVGNGWRVETTAGELHGAVVVNAAGAWAGQLGAMAGAVDIGLRALKRTACLVPPPDGMAIQAWPMIINVEEEFYLKPDAGMLLVSPADETPSNPCDAQADELDVAVAIDRVQHATTLQVRRVAHRWAGLRSFVVDSSPVVGFDPRVPQFFWVAALGGYGIQTAPAVGRIAARLASGQAIESEIADFGVDVTAFSPGRSYAAVAVGNRIGVARG